VAIALVWLYNGLWCKLLLGCPDHAEIVAGAAADLRLPATPVLWALGAAETALALWVLTGRGARAAAWVQTLLVVGMNAAGLLFGSESILRPGALLVHNFVLLVLVWVVASGGRRR
jgi:uncharacterized membrane protein YphA (DoxX/SURF4 family)